MMLSMRNQIRFILSLAIILSALETFAQNAAPPAGAPIEQGTFVLYKFEQAIGKETYELRRDGDSIEAKIDFKFTDRTSAVPLTTTFRAAQDLTPQSFEIKGRTARPITIDESIKIDNGKFHLRNRDKESDSDAPTGPLFTIAGYAPTTMQ